MTTKTCCQSCRKRAAPNVKDYTLSLDSKFFEQINKSMLSLKMKGMSRSRGVVWLQPQVDHIIIYFAKGEYDSNVFDVFPDGWGGYPYIKVNSGNNDMEEIGKIIKKAVEFIKPVL